MKQVAEPGSGPPWCLYPFFPLNVCTLSSHQSSFRAHICCRQIRRFLSLILSDPFIDSSETTGLKIYEYPQESISCRDPRTLLFFPSFLLFFFFFLRFRFSLLAICLLISLFAELLVVPMRSVPKHLAIGWHFIFLVTTRAPDSILIYYLFSALALHLIVIVFYFVTFRFLRVTYTIATYILL